MTRYLPSSFLQPRLVGVSEWGKSGEGGWRTHEDFVEDMKALDLRTRCVMARTVPMTKAVVYHGVSVVRGVAMLQRTQTYE
jgi:hypothetical protein